MSTYKDYRANYKEDPSAYIVIGPHSKNKEFREMYQRMPEDMRRDLQEVWGTQELTMRAEDYRIAFGMDKFSVTQLKEADDTVTNALWNNVVKTLNNPKVKKAENIIQEGSKLIKDSIVIKGLDVLVGNVASNNWLLWMKNVPIKDIAKLQVEAIHAFKTREREHTRRNQLVRELEINPNATNRKSKEAEIAMLKVSIDNNPVSELIESGVFQSIVEDINMEDRGMYVTLLEKMAEPVSSRTPEGIKKIAKHVAMTHDTDIYKVLLAATQMSDFVARYALYTTNVRKGMSKQAAVDDARETFVFYDLTTHKSIQYANDMDGFIFTKFFFRILGVAYKTALLSPSKVLSIFGTEWLFNTNITDIYDSAAGDVTNRMGIPLLSNGDQVFNNLAAKLATAPL